MRSIMAAIIVAVGATDAAAQMTQEERNTHALHGLMHVYAAGMVCYYKTWSFSKQDTDEMLLKIKELSKTVPPKTNATMWTEVQAIMAEGQASATEDRCAQVRQQYAIGRPFLFGTQSQDPGRAPL